MNVSIRQNSINLGIMTDNRISTRCKEANETTITSIAMMKNLFTTEAASIGEVAVAIMIVLMFINLTSNMTTVATIATTMMDHRAASAEVMETETLSLTTSAMTSAPSKTVLTLGMTSKKDLTAVVLDSAMMALIGGQDDSKIVKIIYKVEADSIANLGSGISAIVRENVGMMATIDVLIVVSVDSMTEAE